MSALPLVMISMQLLAVALTVAAMIVAMRAAAKCSSIVAERSASTKKIRELELDFIALSDDMEKVLAYQKKVNSRAVMQERRETAKKNGNDPALSKLTGSAWKAEFKKKFALTPRGPVARDASDDDGE